MGKKMRFLIHKFDEVSSTMEVADTMVRRGAGEGTVVITSKQSRGRGRGRKAWESPVGGLYMSVILRPNLKTSESHKLVYLVGLSAGVALRRLAQKDIRIKWPNDLMYAEKKIGGVLCEGHSIGGKLEYVNLGIGINTNINNFSPELQKKATSVLQITGFELDNEKLAHSILDEMGERYVEFPSNFRELLDEWKALTTTLGRSVICDGVKGRAMDVDEEGYLLFVSEDGERSWILSGNIEHV